MAILDVITAGSVKIYVVDSDPTSVGVDAPLGSLILMTDGSGTYQKINTGITDWTKGVTTANSTAISSVGTVTTGTWNGSVISSVYGGTGLSSYATGDILYASAANTLSKLTIGTAGQVLTIAGGVPTWATPGGGSGTVTSIVAGTNLTGGTITTTGTIALATTLTGLTSVTSTTFVGALTGNASTATTLQTARTINGTSFNGSANITVTAAAGTLTGTTLNATVTGSSLTSVGTITTGTWNGTTIAIARGGTGQTTALAAFNALSPLTTKGDLLTRDATNNIRVPVGTNGQVLIADSAQAGGFKWGSADAIAGQTIRFLAANTANSNSVVNTTTETNFNTNGTNYTMPANTPNANSLLRFLVYGRFSTKNGSVGTLTIRLKVGTTTLTNIVVSPGSNIANRGFQFTGQMQFRTIGASGTVYSHLLGVFDAAGSARSTTYCSSSNGTTTIDTTTTNTIQMSAQWSGANAANSITIEQATFEILN